jgi:hypothetical protein
MGLFRITTFVFMLLASTVGPSASIASDDPSFNAVMARVSKEHADIPAKALQEAMDYYLGNPDKITNKDYITIIDFDQPSINYRMYVINTNMGNVDSYLVAHGINSGDLYAEYFSNTIDSDMSSLGMYLTGNPYIGINGLSMRLFGQDATNSNAYIRDIVLHGASYVSQEFIQETGRLGRSDGCTAVEEQYSADLINKLQNGSVYLVYKSQ